MFAYDKKTLASQNQNNWHQVPYKTAFMHFTAKLAVLLFFHGVFVFNYSDCKGAREDVLSNAIFQDGRPNKIVAFSLCILRFTCLIF